MRRVRKDRFLLGASPDVPDVWSHAVLRQLTESARQQARARQWTSCDHFRATRRTLALLLSRRCLRGILKLPQLEIGIDTQLRALHTCTAQKQADAAFIKLPQYSARISNVVAFNQKQKETTSV